MNTTNDIECAICLELIDNDSKTITVCNHIFHKNCLAQIRNNKCPLCRRVLLVEGLPLQSETLPRRSGTYSLRAQLSMWMQANDTTDITAAANAMYSSNPSLIAIHQSENFFAEMNRIVAD